MICIEGNRVKYEFTYLDYLYYCDRENWKKIMNGEYPIYNKEDDILSVKEDNVEYVLEESVQQEETKQSVKRGDKKHDKIFKDILQNKDEIAHFISTFAKCEVEAEELEIYNPNYITKKFEYRNADIVYKLKNKEQYFLIEHQTKVDYSMAYRIFNYCLEIIRSVVENKEKNRLTYRYPRIVPIVLYTGNKKWSSKNSFAEIQDGISQIDVDKIDVRYKLIDVNEYEKEELLKEKTILANAMILEKCNNNEDVMICLSMIRNNIKDGKQLQELKRIVGYLYENEDETTIREIIKILDEGEAEEDMSTIVERIGRELATEKRAARVEGISIGINQGISQGILQAVRQIVEQMIKMNLEDDLIKQATGAEKSEIEKIRREIKQNS